jgi:intein-encoded DNA endonuclease-like protein
MQKMSNKKFSDEMMKQAVELYNQGLLSREIGEKLGVKEVTVRYWIRKHGIMRHRGPQSMIKKEGYFDVIDCERKAYFLGWLMADANISIYNGQYSLKIHIQEADKDMVYEFLNEIGSTNKVSIHLQKSPVSKKILASCYVSLTSRHMCESLIKLGVVPQKSGKETIPDIDENLLRHFVRGFFDGDGIASSSKKGGKRSGFVSNLSMIINLQKILDVDLKILPHWKTGWLKYFLGGIEFSQKLYHYMYTDASVWIPRKRKVMDEICSSN